MISDSEKNLIAAGVRAAISKLYSGLHSEDDHGFALYKWLGNQKDGIVQSVCLEIEKERNVIPVYTPSQNDLHLCNCACHQFHIEHGCLDCNCGSED
jgi:hypothetical protein